MEQDIKIAIIDEEKIDYIYVGKENYAHYLGLSDYIKEKYPDAITGTDIDFENANNMGLYLREQGNVVFFNNTTYKNETVSVHGKSGIIIVPDELSEKKKELLLELNSQLTSYDSLQLWYAFESRTECKMLMTKSKEQVKTIVNYFLSQYGKSK